MSQDTKQRILDAAERLFAEQGFAAVSTRAVTQAAAVNLASVNYHFGSKDGLLRAVLERRLTPINAARLAALDAAERDAEARGATADLDAVLGAFVRPALGHVRSPEGRSFVQFLGRVHANPEQQRIKEVLFELCANLRDRFLAALCRALPELPFTEICWRFLFVVGAMAHSMTCVDDVRWLSGGEVEPEDAEASADRLIAFAIAGLRAPSPEIAP